MFHRPALKTLPLIVLVIAFFTPFPQLNAQFLDPEMADFNGDGQVTPAEEREFQMFLNTVSLDNPLMVKVVLAYADAFAVGTSIVDLSDPFANLTQPASLSTSCKGFIRGDANRDGQIDLGDVAYINNYLWSGGPPPDPLDSGDANDTGNIEVGDPIYLQNYLYFSGPRPPLPFGKRPGTQEPYFSALDPTPDSLDNPCDLRVQDFSEFHIARGDSDLVGDSDDDAIWIVPEGQAIRLEEVLGEGGYVYAENLGNDILQLVVAKNQYIYAVADDSAGTVFVLKDTDVPPDGHSDFELQFMVGPEGPNSPILDAALVDVSGHDYGDQALITLHDVNGHEYLVINVDSDQDGIIEGPGEAVTPYYYLIPGQRLDNPNALAVDGRSARVFVSGHIAGQPAVVFYRDLDGDKLIDPDTDPQNPDSSWLYFDDTQISGTDVDYPGIQYLSEDKTLLILAISSTAGESSVICVKDPEDYVFSWSEACRSATILYDAGGEETKPKYLRGYSFSYSSTKYFRAYITLQDRWSTLEIEMIADGPDCCFESSPTDEWFAVPEAALSEANKHRQNLCFVKMRTKDFVTTLCLNFDVCSDAARCPREKRWIWGFENNACGTKPALAKVEEGPKNQGDIYVYWWSWFNPGVTTIWMSIDAWWKVNTEDNCACSSPDYHQTQWELFGHLKDWNGNQWFDLFFDDPDKKKIVTLEEQYGLSGGCPKWTGDPKEGEWHGTKNQQILIPPHTPFTMPLTLKIHVSRVGGGAGYDETPWMKILLRPRCH